MNKILLFFFKIYIYIISLFVNIGFCFWLLYYALRHPHSKYWNQKPREKPPACLMDPSWGRHGFAQLKDVNLHYVENGDRSKPLMLFIHGFPEFWYSWRYQLKEFSNDYWTVAMDLRGFGDSDKPSGLSNYTIAKIIEDIRQLILFFGREKVILVSHDWGGLLMWNFLDHHVHMVEKFVVLNCPYHRNFFKTMLIRPTQFMKSWYCFFFQFPFLPEFALKINDFQKFDVEMRSSITSSITDEDMEVYKYMFSRPGALKCGVDYYRSNCGVVDIAPRLKDFPVGLMLFGENDNYLETHFIKVAKQLIPNLRTHVVKNANHFVQQDQPMKVNAAIYAYLNDEPFSEE